MGLDRAIRAIRSVLGGLVVAGCGAFAVLALWTWIFPTHPVPAPPSVARVIRAPAHLARLGLDTLSCLSPKESTAAAADNRATLNTAVLQPFGVPEAGWAIYAPLIGHEIGTVCGPESPGFAAAFARWQSTHSLPATGRVDGPALSALGLTWLLRRPFVLAMKTGCPPPPAENTLATAAPAEAYGGKVVRARPAALEAYRRMIAAARQDLGGPPALMSIASAYRDPTDEAARCASGGCGGPARAHCSAHRTGLAFDLYLGSPPSRAPFSTANDDRLWLSRSAPYHWLVDHAGQFGFLPYPYEPWHWEWTGEPV